MHTLAILLLAAVAGAAPASDPYGAFMQGVERGLSEGREDALVLDVDSLLRFVTRDVQVSEKFRTGFVTGYTKATAEQGLGKTLVNSFVRAGGSVKVLRVKERKGGARALLRAIGPRGVNYVELYLERDPAGRVLIVDAYVYLSGETLGETGRRGYIMAAAEAKQGLFDRLQGKERVLFQNMERIRAMREHLVAQKWAEVLADYDGLPPVLRKERMYLAWRLTAASALGDEARYQRAIEEFEAAFPGDPSLDLVSIDGHVLRKQYTQALACIDRLDRRVDDPYLEVMRGNVLYVQNDREGARKRFGAAIAREPTLGGGYLGMITLGLDEKDFASVAEMIGAAKDRAGLWWPELEKMPEFAEFVKSREYRAWKAQAGASKPR